MEQPRDLPRDRAELLERIHRSRSQLEHLINGLTPEQLTGPVDASGWTVKDHLVHLATWERSITFLLQGRPRHEGLGVNEAAYREADEDRINAVIHTRTRDLPLPDALAEWRAAHQQVLDTLNGLTDADLFKTYSQYLPDEPGEDSGAPVITWVVGNTVEHQDMHRVWIETILASNRAGA